jgi:hypothetical protein
MPVTYVPITTTTFTTTTASVTFSSLPATYNDLIIIGQGKANASTSTLIDVGVRFNGDTGSNYSTVKIFSLSYASITQTTALNSVRAETYLDANSTDNALGSGFKIDLFDYNTTYSYKNYLNRAACMTQSDKGVFASASTWKNTAAITSITIYADGGSGFYAGTTIALYGIKRA